MAEQPSSSSHRHLRSQQEDPARAYANLPLPQPQPQTSAQLEYANVASADSRPAELTDPQLNYMDMDFSTGRGLYAARTVPYALLGGAADVAADAAARCSAEAPRELPLSYVELDFRAMAALAATAQAERELPTCRAQWRRPGSGNGGSSSQPAKASSFARLRSSVAKSISRLSPRRQSKAAANSGQN